MEIKKFKKGNKANVLKLQAQIGFALPADYINFLLENDGAVITDGYFYVEDLKEFILMDVFYGITEKEESINVLKVNDEFKNDMPQNSLLIGEDPGGAFILLVNADNKNSSFENGVYFYDHANFFENSTNENNTYLICENFSKFMHLLETTKFNE